MAWASAIGGVCGFTGAFILALHYVHTRTPFSDLSDSEKSWRWLKITAAIVIVVCPFFITLIYLGYYDMWWVAGPAFLTALIWEAWWNRRFSRWILRSKVRGTPLPARSYRLRHCVRLFWFALKSWARNHRHQYPVDVRRKHLAGLGLIAAFLLMLHLYRFSLSTYAPVLHHDPVMQDALHLWACMGQTLRVVAVVGLAVITLVGTLLLKQSIVTRMLQTGNSRWFQLAKFMSAAVLCGLFGMYVVFRGRDLVWHLRDAFRPFAAKHDAIFLTPLFVLVLPACIVLGATTFYVFIGILGRVIVPHAREGVIKNIAILFKYTFIWLLMATKAFYGPVLLYEAGPFQITGFAILMLICIVVGFLSRPRAYGSQQSRYFRGMIELATTYTFFSGVLITVSLIVSRALLGIRWTADSSGLKQYWMSIDDSLTPAILFISAGIAVLVVLLPARIGINQSSMHMFYRGRLAWAFLSEPLPGRERLQLREYESERATITHLDDLVAHKADCHYKGPYLLLNAALNLVKGKELAWQERMAASFVFSPMFCGYQFPRRFEEDAGGYYQRTDTFTYGGRPRLYLAQAMAISGSALGTSMGFHTTPRVRMFHTFFNVRLGWWFPNPAYIESWTSNVPRSRVNMLWDEFWGNTNDDGSYVYLSDGGHFDNLGLYELVRRKCRLIIISDASEDAQHIYRGLGNAIQRCRTDFGVEIDLDPSQLNFRNQPSPTRAFAIGRVLYEPGNPEGLVGVLAYIKSVVNRKVPLDILAFKQASPEFPDHSTLNQWFLESHFESYRVLGLWLARDFARKLKGATFRKDIHSKAEALYDSSQPQ